MKEVILAKLHEIIDKQIANAKNAMDAAQESAMSDGKSSAGDKFETGRAMGHRDRDMYANQLAVALSEKSILYKINGKEQHLAIGMGSLVHTTAGIFFISISLGKISVDGEMIYAISSQANVALELMRKEVGDHFLMQGKEHEILAVI
jgi:hypothetical protein